MKILLTKQTAAELCRRKSGVVLAVSVALLAVVLSPASAQAQDYTYQVLYSFAPPPDAQFSDSGFVLDGKGNLYATSAVGGAFSLGTVFELDATGKETVLHSFSGIGGDGAGPASGVILDAQGNLYGSTLGGGDLTCDPPAGCGTVYKVDPAGNETILYAFTALEGDGERPSGDLVLDRKGNLYGTTSRGGTSLAGTIFKLTKAGVESVLSSFDGAEQGATPEGVVMDASGNLFGATQFGGLYGDGTLFELVKNGSLITLHSFNRSSGDAINPNPRLVLDSQGNLYGTSFLGGHVSRRWPFGAGVVFKVDVHGNETVLHTFCLTGESPCLDGARPVGGLVMDSAGNLYGTTSADGSVRGGTIFKIDPAGNETVLRNFKKRDRSGFSPEANLAIDTQGDLYGDGGGGTSLDGVVFGMLIPSEVTTTTLTSTPNPSKSGETVTFTAVVVSLTGAPPDGEAVTFLNRKTPIGTAMLSGGSASISISTLQVGTTKVTALYGGDPHLIGSSNTEKQVVTKTAGNRQ